tara:strand:- start:7660 stop:8436 length:777 start_codon:yes stop_codon:yes gene_type:complete
MLSQREKKKLISLVKDLGNETEKLKSKSINISLKSDKSPLTQADIFVNQELRSYINQTKFKNVISEEDKLKDYEERKRWNFFWMIDPIDGTKDFISKGNDYTINIALCKKNCPVFSIVFAPARDELFYAEAGYGSYKNNQKLKTKLNKKRTLKVVVSRSHTNTETKNFITKLKETNTINTKKFASSLKICKIADGSADIYPRLSPTMEWDTCAAHLILEEANGFIIDTQGKSITYNKESLLNPSFFAVCREDIISEKL